MPHKLSREYKARVASGEVRHDAAQAEVLHALDPIRRYLEESSEAKGLRGLFRKAPEPPKGVYLWGGVGRGKSMLMDLFFAEVEIEAKRRVHFHAFMQEVHAGLEKARKQGVSDAVVPVADAIADEVRLLCFDEMQITDIADAMIVGRLFERLLERGGIVVTT